MLIELDGADQRPGVFVIGATNRHLNSTTSMNLPLHQTSDFISFCRPEAIDRAILRPGRFGKAMYVPLPSSEERILILKTLSRKKPLAVDVDLSVIAQDCENFSGADLSSLVQTSLHWRFEHLGTGHCLIFYGRFQVNEAAMVALEEKERTVDQGISSSVIKTSHFDLARMKVTPSVSVKVNFFTCDLLESHRIVH